MNHSEGTFELTKAECKALAAFACRDRTRGHICGVHFDPGCASVAATDGHTLVEATAAESHGSAPFTVPLDSFEQAAKLLRGRDPRLGVQLVDGAVVLTDGKGGEVRCIPIVATFPAYRTLVPNGDNSSATPTIGIDMEYYARLALVQKAAGVKGLKLHLPPNDLNPIKATCEGWVALIMPMKI